MFSNKDFFDFADINDYGDSCEVEEKRRNLKTNLEAKDEAIFNSSWRMHRGYCAHDKKQRTVITGFGSVTIKRRRYYYYEDNKRKYICLLDNEVGINPYERVHETLKQRIVKISAASNCYRDILEKFEYAGITEMTVSRIIKNFQIEKITDSNNYDIKKVKVDDVLNIQMDDCFLKVIEKRQLEKQRTILITINTVHDEKNAKSRRKAGANKHVFAMIINQKIAIGCFLHFLHKKIFTNIFLN